MDTLGKRRDLDRTERISPIEEAEADNPRLRNTMRIRNLTHTSIILALETERLYFEPMRKPAIVRWTQNRIGDRLGPVPPPARRKQQMGVDFS